MTKQPFGRSNSSALIRSINEKQTFSEETEMFNNLKIQEKNDDK